MENLVNKIKEILDINVTSYRISKITGITELVLSKYRKGTYNVKNMSLETADKLISNISEIEKYAKWTEKIKCKQIEENLKERYKMTFEEAIELLDNVKEAETREFTDQFGRIDEDSLEIENYRLWAKEVHKVISTLQETYAPKIKMTSEQKDELMQFLDESDFGFENFWFCLGSGANLYNEFTENELMRAWLHPELIEVEDE